MTARDAWRAFQQHVLECAQCKNAPNPRAGIVGEPMCTEGEKLYKAHILAEAVEERAEQEMADCAEADAPRDEEQFRPWTPEL